MIANRYVRIVVVLGMVAFMCGVVNAAGVGIIAETHVTSGASAPACPSSYQCMAETAAIAQWGVNGYEREDTKTICGQSADAMVQYYCIRQAGSTASGVTNAPAQAPASGTAAPAAPAAAGVTQSPVGFVTILAAIGAALLAAAGMRRK